MDGRPAYEVRGHRPDGEVFAVEALDEEAEGAALVLALAYADYWRRTVSLCRVPSDGVGPDDPRPARRVEVVARLYPAREARA